MFHVNFYLKSNIDIWSVIEITKEKPQVCDKETQTSS